jgi:hypothetical protein
MKPVIVVVLVDALGWTLAQREPGFAPRLSERKPLATVLGFSSGALPTAFTGRPTREHGRWLMYERARGPGAFRGFGALRWLPKRVRTSLALTRLLERVVAGRGIKGYFNLYEVPRAELEAFDLPERGDIFAPGGLPCESLGHARPPLGRVARLELAHARVPARSEALACLAQGEHDSCSCTPRCSTRGSTTRARAAKGSGRRSWNGARGSMMWRAAAARAGREPWLYPCSDHGMVDAHARRPAARRGAPHAAPRRPFFDSTMARFWARFAGPRRHPARTRRRAVRTVAAEVDAGTRGADFADARFGEDVFLLEPERCSCRRSWAAHRSGDARLPSLASGHGGRARGESPAAGRGHAPRTCAHSSRPSWMPRLGAREPAGSRVVKRGEIARHVTRGAFFLAVEKTAALVSAWSTSRCCCAG